MSLDPGTKLSSYEILSPLGKGGMGEVYRARDTKLDRDVAIKVLPEALAADEERVARFEREAKLLASLNHPNIASIFGFESSGFDSQALILELVEGPTLAETIAEGPIPVGETLAITTQIVNALEAGHEAGIIHRDLKPANIKVKEDGTVKVLDYGLAKALDGNQPPSADADLSQSPTLTRQGTQLGVILGTAAYMSPEQAKGKPVDERADVWALGAVVYEMLTGKRAFGGDDVADTIAHVLTREPDWEALPEETTPTLRRVVELCLTKSLNDRVRAMADVRLALSGAFETGSTAPRAQVVTNGWRPSIAAAAALVVLASVVTGVAVRRGATPSEPSPRSITRFSIPLPPDVALTEPRGRRPVLALSPDGTRLVYAADDMLHLRDMSAEESTTVRGTEGASGPVFSPDGEWVGFWQDGSFKKVAVRGGAPVTLTAGGLSARGARWNDGDRILFGRDGAGIMQASADGGNADVLVPIVEGTEAGDGALILPGGNASVFTLGSSGRWDNARIAVHSFETGETKTLIERGKQPRYLPSGHLVYASDGTLYAVPFSADALEVTGGPIAVADGLATADSGVAPFDVSRTGSLVYLRGGDARRSLVWVTRDGTEEALPAEPRRYHIPRVSPDGRRLAVSVMGGESDIWIWDFEREAMTRFTFDPAIDAQIAWTPDSKRVVFNSNRDGRFSLYWKVAAGTGAAERLRENKGARFQSPLSFTPEGDKLLFLEFTQEVNVGVLTIGGSEEPLFASEFGAFNLVISPDGKWIAYDSNTSGRREVYVRPFPDVERGQSLVSSGGGRDPVWRSDGRELFYRSLDGTLMAVPVELGASFEHGTTEELFSGCVVGNTARNYDVSSDGQRFLMVKENSAGSEEFVLVLNWIDELKRLVPTDG